MPRDWRERPRLPRRKVESLRPEDAIPEGVEKLLVIKPDDLGDDETDEECDGDWAALDRQGWPAGMAPSTLDDQARPDEDQADDDESDPVAV